MHDEGLKPTVSLSAPGKQYPATQKTCAHDAVWYCTQQLCVLLPEGYHNGASACHHSSKGSAHKESMENVCAVQCLQHDVVY